MLDVSRLRSRLRLLYEGRTPVGRWFLYGILALDLLALLFIVASSFLPRSEAIRAFNLLFGAIFLAEFVTRFASDRRPLRELFRLTTWTDVAAIVSFLASASGEGAGFLRVLRTLRVLRAFRVAQYLREDTRFFRRYEEVILAVANLFVFIFVMTGVVYETQRYSNEHIRNYVDALYFTVTALTTTGFGDITLPGTIGRLITVVIMIFGVTLFLNLARVLVSPSKVRFSCPSCGLQRHDVDAVHCKACGIVLNIPDEGLR